MPVRIVVLDAEPVVRSVVTGILERGGYVAEPVESFEAAAEIVATAPPDLLLTNVYLPGITGREAMRLLKGICPALPVLMVSGLPDEDVIEEWVGTEGFDTFPKPFKPEELLDKVRVMLAR
jgi:DNA-binding response OmpR family regulator